ncbi:arsenite efflux transporter metallochaperone ArsD [Faecalispora anaeroviscerum]|uniref:arsenite efflux transporter metallochaperone ArsD n=1 Tax=Faecalispora anaeroviscerum TaxID=2991836 RepID=UPI0024B8979D|nr:arsenite efflux transporter metallochaperone ArsD [Faecalispora anaeroviscerum]
MSKMVIFDPAMCCSTGVCGPSVDPELLRVAAVLENLKKAGIEVARHNLSAEPQAFMRSEAVSSALNKKGVEVLPITMVDGNIVKSGSYPTNEEFTHLLGVSLDAIKPATKTKVNKCGCGPKGCC